MSGEESTKPSRGRRTSAETAVVAVEDNGWKKEGSCKINVTDQQTNKTKEVDGFKWTKHVGIKDEKGVDYEIYLPVGVTPSQHGAYV